ncbi:tRNA (cytosine(34)-C(5))-methyltransferase, mitochondrial [Hoplias malabaricus]|uniref:tRNA (cytosine(34)-C(5))-methyltransferase, mitochondrial n=1 Tax=Hoplias malabaricus TaxID=27720 RepID=UPI0034636840
MLFSPCLSRAGLLKRFNVTGSIVSASPELQKRLRAEHLKPSLRASSSQRLSAPDSGPPRGQSKAKPQRRVWKRVLQHFDSQYSEELGEHWPPSRAVLVNPHCWQYGVLLNRFSDLTGILPHLKSLGYYSLLPQTDPLNSQAKSHSASVHGLLQCLVHKEPLRLPTQRHRAGWLKQYFLLNAASLLPVLALDVRDGEKVLDLCSAPGGKALALLQVATPGLLHCNEMDKSRFEWLLKTLESYIPPSLRDMVTMTNMDGRVIGGSQPGTYDKVLVDAPCSNDRSWLFSPGAQQGELWLRERAQLPHLQKQLLCSALAAVRPGGLLVYSTCTLSRAENQSVIESVLATCPGVELVDLEEDLIGFLSEHFTFASLQPPLGYLVVPEQGRTWGPMFVCKLRRIS